MAATNARPRGLAPIVGAFASGLILEDLHYAEFVGREEHTLEELIRPISAFLAPVFFVLGPGHRPDDRGRGHDSARRGGSDLRQHRP